MNKVIIMQNHLSIPSTVPQVQNQISEKSNMRVFNINYENNKKCMIYVNTEICIIESQYR